MKRLIIPVLLVAGIVLLLSVQCTMSYQWMIWGVKIEFLPALLLYIAFTVNLPTALLLALISAVSYDSFSLCRFGTSAIPYLASTAFFCFIRPIFFRNRILTQFLSGMAMGFLTLSLQWLLGGKRLPVDVVLSKLTSLSFFSGLLSIIYFTFLDTLCRLMGLDPSKIEDQSL